MNILRQVAFTCFVCLLLVPTGAAQDITGSTTIDIDPDTGDVLVVCETTPDDITLAYYQAAVTCIVYGDGTFIGRKIGTVVRSGTATAAFVFAGVPGTTYTATGTHSATISYLDQDFSNTLNPTDFYDAYNFGYFESPVQTYPDTYDWFGPGPPEGWTSSYVQTGKTTATKSWPCFAQLKYRAVTPALGISIGNHSFWWIQDSAGKQYIIDGGPQNAGCYINCGYLVDWVTPGTVGHYPEDQIGAGTWFDSGTSPDVCTQVDALETAARNWPQAQTTYFVPGPNSNTFAHAMATSGNFAATQPPSATGW